MRQFAALRIIIFIYKASGSVVALGTAFLISYAWADILDSASQPSIWLFIAAFLMGEIFAVSLYAFGELIDVFLYIEDNTRQSAETQQHMLQVQAQANRSPRVPKEK